MPPRVWTAFRSWYGSTVDLPRYVIQYQRTESDYNVINKKGKALRIIRKIINNEIYEIETDELYIKYDRLREDGKRIKDNMKELYISRRKSIFDLKMMISGSFKINDILRTRIWLDEELV